MPGNYDLPHLQAFHRYIFGDLYDWAGELRTVTLGKGGALFCLPQDLVATADDVFTRLARDHHLRGRDRTAFIDGLTALLAGVNALHPFREGNGRTQRAFLAQLARDAGYRIRWAELDPETIPATVGQWAIDASVSFTKGCYTGQELVARIDSRGGNVPRRLRGLVLEAGPDAIVHQATALANAPEARAPP